MKENGNSVIVARKVELSHMCFLKSRRKCIYTALKMIYKNTFVITNCFQNGISRKIT